MTICPGCGIADPVTDHFRENPECQKAAGRIAGQFAVSKRTDSSQGGRPPVWKTCPKCGKSGLTARELAAHACGTTATVRRRRRASR